MISKLIDEALKSREYAYTPYSNFKVGAALLTKSKTIYTGCNIENAAFSPTNCAERTAIFKAVSQGERDFEMIAIVGGKGEVTAYCPPCGVCRQVLAEFCSLDEFKIVLAISKDKYKIYTLRELLPLSFSEKNL